MKSLNLSVDPAVYTAEYYKTSNYADYLERADRYKKTAYELNNLLRLLNLVDKNSSIVDFGCALGFLIEGFKEVGLSQTVGVEVSDWARREAQNRGLTVFKFADDVIIHKRQVDLLVALDVFEHMIDDEIEKSLRRLQPQALLVRIPCSTDGGKTFHLQVSRQDPTHVNCKTKDQWIEFLRGFGYCTFLKLNLFTVYDTAGVSCLLIL